MSVQPSFVPQPGSRRGPADSDEYNDMIAAMAKDLVDIASQANINEVSILSVSKLLFFEFLNSRNNARDRYEQIRRDNWLKAVDSEPITTFIGFGSFVGPDYHINYDNIVLERRVRVEPVYGQALLPYNHLENKMYSVDPETGDTVLPPDLDYDLVVDAQGGVEVEGTVTKAFDGNNRNYWIHKVHFPLEEDVDSITAELTVQFPDSIIDRANMLTIHAFPLGQLDIEEIKYSTDSSDPTTDLPGFSVIRGAGFERLVFSELQITKLKIKFRQRQFVEENGRKAFYMGAQEIGLKLVGFDQTLGETQPVDNNSLVVVVDAPTGYIFSQLTRLRTNPEYATGIEETGIRVRIYTDEDLTNEVWSSYDDDRLEVTPVDVSDEATNRLWLLVNLQMLTATGLTPLLDNIMFTYTTET